MRFLPKNKKFQKTIIVISDLHLGAGLFVNGQRNPLEDFFFDQELVDFISHYSSGKYQDAEVELVINGDFWDFLAVPYIEYFDDEFWSESAALEKLKIMMKAHHEVVAALQQFVATKNKKLIYIIGNHDAELLFDSVKKYLIEMIAKNHEDSFILRNDLETYQPVPGVYIQHGHQYEKAHDYRPAEVLISSKKGENYFVPPWGSYYVTHIINKFKQERSYVNYFKPIKNMLFHGLVFDPFFTLRFMLANVYYYFMVRFWHFYIQKKSLNELKNAIVPDLILFEDYEKVTRKFYAQKEDAKVLIVGHTHEPLIKEFADGSIFVNTGTWTKIINLNFDKYHIGYALTYAKIQVQNDQYQMDDFKENVQVDLLKWKGRRDRPYEDFI